MVIYPSVASSDPLCYGETISSLSPWPYLHIDVEDGNFTPNITFGMKTVEAVCRRAKGRSLQVHMMVSDPMFYLADLASSGVTSVFAHIEALKDPEEYLARCRGYGMKAGFALKAGTDTEPVIEALSRSDGVLFLTSAPMPVKEEFVRSAFDRALMMKKVLPPSVECVADGGIDEERLEELALAGFDSVVLGRTVFSHPDPMERIRELDEKICNWRKR